MTLKQNEQNDHSSGTSHDSNFFDASNTEAAAVREKLVGLLP